MKTTLFGALATALLVCIASASPVAKYVCIYTGRQSWPVDFSPDGKSKYDRYGPDVVLAERSPDGKQKYDRYGPDVVLAERSPDGKQKYDRYGPDVVLAERDPDGKQKYDRYGPDVVLAERDPDGKQKYDRYGPDTVLAEWFRRKQIVDATAMSAQRTTRQYFYGLMHKFHSIAEPRLSYLLEEFIL